MSFIHKTIILVFIFKEQIFVLKFYTTPRSDFLLWCTSQSFGANVEAVPSKTFQCAIIISNSFFFFCEICRGFVGVVSTRHFYKSHFQPNLKLLDLLTSLRVFLPLFGTEVSEKYLEWLKYSVVF